jgi:hypothetical protein
VSCLLADHYDSTSSGVADIAIGEDDFGIWVAGSVRPGVTEEQIYELRASDISGDWRDTGGSDLELVAALAVNVNGFPVISVAASGGRQTSLVAAGRVTREDEEAQSILDADKIGAAVARHLSQLKKKEEKREALRARFTKEG